MVIIVMINTDPKWLMTMVADSGQEEWFVVVNASVVDKLVL